MGMYDTITVTFALDGDDTLINAQFQTKDLDCLLLDYEFTEDGRLLEHRYDYEETPPDELPFPKQPFIGAIRRVPHSLTKHDVNYHGIINMYTHGLNQEWIEFDLVFTHGKLEEVRRVLNKPLED